MRWVELRDEIFAAMESAAQGEEIVGAIVGRRGAPLRFVRFKNTAASPQRGFDVGAADLLDLFAPSAAPVRAFVHSHPEGPAALSRRDQQQMIANGRPTYPGIMMVVVAPNHLAVFDFDPVAGQYSARGDDIAVLGSVDA